MNRSKIAVSAAAVLIFGAIVAALFIVEVGAGATGVVYNRITGEVAPEPLGPGWHIVAPWRQAAIYPATSRTVEIAGASAARRGWLPGAGNPAALPARLPTSDGTALSADVSYAYHVETDQLTTLFAAYRGRSAASLEARDMRNQLLAIMRETTSAYPLADLYGEKRTEAEDRIREQFAAALAPNGITIDAFAFLDLRPDESFVRAAQAKIDAQQELERANAELERKNAEAEARRVEAESIAEKARIEAESAADKVRIEAESAAEKSRIEAEAEAERKRIASEAQAG